MTFTIETHADRTFTDPTITVVETVDKPLDETFIPRVIISDSTGEYSHTLPPQPYVNGTWIDEDVEASVTNYFNSL
jgi:hypothetical protein